MRFPYFTALCTALIAVVIAVPARCGPIFDRVMKTGTVRFGVPHNRVPQGFLDDEGRLVGFEVDLARHMAEHMGKTLDTVKVNDRTWKSLLSAGKIDAALCRIRHTRSLESEFDFSVPYFHDAAFVLVLNGRVKDLKELQNNKIAAVQGSIPEKIAMNTLRNLGDPNAEKNVVSYPDRPACFLALGKEKVSGWVDRGLILLEYASRKPARFELIRVDESAAPLAVALPHNDSEWRDLVNFTLQDVAADGTLEKLFDKWFGEKSAYRFPRIGRLEIWPQ